MKDIQKLLKSEAGSVLPDEKIKENIRRDLGIADEAREREFSLAGNAGGSAADGAKRRNRLLAIVLACVALVLCLILVIVPLMKKDASSPNKFNPIGTVSDFYAYGAASVGAILVEQGAAPAAQSMQFSAPLSSGNGAGYGGSLTEEQMQKVNRYMSLVEELMSEGEIGQAALEDTRGYAYAVRVYYSDMLGGKVSYDLYYNREYVGGETDGDETESEYSITGILVVNGAEYPVQGGMETEEEEGESESELTFVAYTGVDSYIRVEQEFEQEEGEREQKYVYTVAENGRVLEKTEVEYEEEEGEVKLKMTVQRADGTKDELSFEDESEKGVRKLRVDARMDGEEISFCIYIEQEVYRYEFENGSHDFDRHWHDDDDDDDD